MSRALDAQGSGIRYGQQHVGRPLLTPDEVRTLSPDRQLLFLTGQRPAIATKSRYYADREFTGGSIAPERFPPESTNPRYAPPRLPGSCWSAARVVSTS